MIRQKIFFSVLHFCTYFYIAMFSTILHANKDSMEFILIEGGQYNMGDLSGASQSQLPVHQVHIKKYYLSKNEVTRGQFSEFVEVVGYVTESEINISHKKCKDKLGRELGNLSWKNPGFSQDNNHPVVCVSYNDAKNFINWLNKKSNRKYRLPSEAEWEFAGRAGTKTEYSFGDNANLLCKYGNNYAHPNMSCRDNFEYTSPIGEFKPNPWGFNDMHGNVWELVEDCWNKNYINAPQDGSAWKSGDCNLGVIRGGGWAGYPIVSLSSFRGVTRSMGNNIGFRLALL